MNSKKHNVKELQDGLVKMKCIVSKLNQKESDLASFFEMSPDLCVIARDGYFRIVNDVWTDVTGFTPEELTSKHWIDFIHPDDVEKTLIVNSLLIQKPCYNFINRHLSKQGHYITLSWNAKQTPDGIIYACARVM